MTHTRKIHALCQKAAFFILLALRLSDRLCVARRVQINISESNEQQPPSLSQSAIDLRMRTKHRKVTVVKRAVQWGATSERFIDRCERLGVTARRAEAEAEEAESEAERKRVWRGH